MGNVAKKAFDYTKTNFAVNWASGVALVGAITWAVTVTIQNSGYRAKIDGQGTTIKTQGETISTLKNTVSTLEGSMQTVNSAIRAFTENPPSALEAKIDGLSRVIQIYHGSTAVSNTNMPQPDTEIPADTIRMGSSGTPVQPPN